MGRPSTQPRPPRPPPPLPEPLPLPGPWEQNSIQYRFEQIRSTEKKNCIGVSQSKILIDATISYSFQIKPWGYEEMKNSDEKVNISAFSDVRNWSKNWRKRKRYLGGRNYSPIRDDYDDMIYTLLLTNVNMYTGRVCDYPFQSWLLETETRSKNGCSESWAAHLHKEFLGVFNRACCGKTRL